MGSNPFIGVIYHWIGGFASATNFIPFRGIKRWSWEIYWLIQGVAAWIIAPLVLGCYFVPNLFRILRESYAAHPRNVIYALLFGILWGVGGLTFGLAIRYLGIALGYAIALGLCAAFGTVVPPIIHGQFGEILHQSSGQVILLGVAVCVIGVAVNGAAGISKDKEFTPEEKEEAGETDFNFGKGLAIAVLAGLMSSFFAFGLDAGKPIGDLTKERLLAGGRLDLWQNLPILVVVLWGGFITNFVWSSILILKNRSIGQFTGTPGLNPMRAAKTTGDTLADFDPEDPQYSERLSGATLLFNYLFAGLAGVIWYFQFFFYSMGQTKMGKYDFSSWTLHMASIIIFATLWGIFLKEWKGTSMRTKMLVACGLALLIGSTVIVGYGNYMKAAETLGVGR
ncbi:L-rhamnose/proton symporter RhaT [Granulicella tundricola]|uniref:RhaT l-rhamnose-proton symport 2 n=1 Tax=Granulicella tundricola (strain ATCC BAA-1859 / DSM 23138 / MP5ACTX9) TaxID=1198114 RepID=E8WZ87_GRATM|nr:rhamnose/proton symporter RhaT [Granulicella tundricola]ADW67689.1 RhaT l-rhamnose-proton symport 2 [Granulicella tundricola MP5ACTX9]